MSAITTKSTQPSALSEFWYYFSRNKGAVIGFGIFLDIEGALLQHHMMGLWQLHALAEHRLPTVLNVARQ